MGFINNDLKPPSQTSSLQLPSEGWSAVKTKGRRAPAYGEKSFQPSTTAQSKLFSASDLHEHMSKFHTVSGQDIKYVPWSAIQGHNDANCS